MAANELSERQRMLITLAVGVLLNAGLGGWFYFGMRSGYKGSGNPRGFHTSYQLGEFHRGIACWTYSLGVIL